MPNQNETFAKAHGYFKQGQYAEAVRVYRLAIFDPSDGGNYWGNLGAVLFNFVEKNLVPYVGSDIRIASILGDSPLVSETTRQLWFSILNRPHCEGLKACIKEAERCWKKAIEIDPSGDFWSRAFLIQLYERMADFGKAQEQFDRAKTCARERDDREWLEKEWEYFKELKAKDIDALLRPKAGTAAAPIHEMYGDELGKLLEEIKQLHHDEGHKGSRKN